MAQLGARLDGIEEVVGSNPIGSTNFDCNIPVAHPFRGEGFPSPTVQLSISLRAIFRQRKPAALKGLSYNAFNL